MPHEWAKGLLAATLLIGLVATILPIQDWRREADPQENMPGMARGLFGDERYGDPMYLFAFELLSILLLAALLGALYLAVKPKKGEEDSR